jgi:hypothetical protein
LEFLGGRIKAELDFGGEGGEKRAGGAADSKKKKWLTGVEEYELVRVLKFSELGDL